MRLADIPYLDSRSQFEQNFYLVIELIKSKRMAFSTEAATISATSLLKIRSAPNGRISLATINEAARVTANGIKQMMIEKP